MITSSPELIVAEKATYSGGYREGKAIPSDATAISCNVPALNSHVGSVSRVGLDGAGWCVRYIIM